MRDLWLLRTRLHAALGSGLLLAACGPSPAAAPVATASAKAEAKQAAPAEVKSEPRPLEPLPELPPAPVYPERTGQDPFDPDGIEEEGCPNGDWCGSPAAAGKFQVANAEVEMGCPTRLMGKPDSGVSPNDRTYKGLSMNPMMMGRLRKIATEEKRKAGGDANVCCYHWFDYCSGRPLLDGDEAMVAATAPGTGWLGEHVPEDMVGEPPAELRPLLAAAWLADAQYEHASVASFARAALELMAVGAPAELLAGCAQAGLDEVRHAQLCFALAAAYGEAMQPGPLPPLSPRAGGLVALAVDTLREGCVGETIAALTALRARQVCRAPAAGAALATIAEDETRHAELAWATLAWAVRVGGREVAEAVRAAAEELRAEAFAERTPEPEADLSRWGRLGAVARADARRDAWTGVLDETLALVLAAAHTAAPEARANVCGASARDPMM